MRFELYRSRAAIISRHYQPQVTPPLFMFTDTGLIYAAVDCRAMILLRMPRPRRRFERARLLFIARCHDAKKR